MHKEVALELQRDCSEALDVIDFRLARCLREMAISHIHFGEYDKAVELISQSITIDKEIGIHPPSWFAEINMGLAHLMEGKLDKAEAVLVETLERREEIYGVDDRVNFMSVVNSVHLLC